MPRGQSNSSNLSHTDMAAPLSDAVQGHDKDHEYRSFTSASEIGVVSMCLRVETATSVFLALGGTLLRSQALLADAFHAFGDVGSGLITAVAVRFGTSKGASKLKIASLASFVLNATLLVAAGSMGLSALSELVQSQRLYSKGSASIIYDDSLEITKSAPDAKAAWVAVLCIVSKLYLYQATTAVARRQKSAVLEAYAMHHLLDSVTSVITLAVTACSLWLDTEVKLDSVGSLVISAVVLSSGLRGIFDASKELFGQF